MAELPKSVIARMKAQALPPEHPDADLLAAFAEQALTGRERENVLAHLAACRACREVIALASPPPAASQPVRVFVPWYKRPQIFAWAGTLATVALMAALLLNYGQNRYASRSVSDVIPAQTPAPPPAENKQAAAGAPQDNITNGSLGPLTTSEKTLADKGASKTEPKAKTAQEERRKMAAAPALAQVPAKDQKKLGGGALQSQFSVMKEAAASPAAAPPTPPAPSARAADSVSIQRQVASASESVEVQGAAPARAENADIAANTVPTGHGVGGGMMHAQKTKAISPPVAHWSISDKGKLQLSQDRGRTWTPVLTDDPTVFHAVATVGNEVWAGGSGPVVFHSADGGLSWRKQSVPGASADIVALQFSDAQHGSLKTADGGAWSSSDGGQHWTKQ